jgi:hypothetical protein
LYHAIVAGRSALVVTGCSDDSAVHAGHEEAAEIQLLHFGRGHQVHARRPHHLEDRVVVAGRGTVDVEVPPRVVHERDVYRLRIIRIH